MDIEDKLVPKGEAVVRHLALPETGNSSEWILSEMAKMDEESKSFTDWRHGKLSGAVYRVSLPFFHCRMTNFDIALRRW